MKEIKKAGWVESHSGEVTFNLKPREKSRKNWEKV